MRRVTQVFSSTGGADIDTGILDVEEFHSLGFYFNATVGASGAIFVLGIDEAGNQFTLINQGSVTAGNFAVYALGRECGVSSWPVPRRIQVLFTKGAATNIGVKIIGIVDDPDLP